MKWYSSLSKVLLHEGARADDEQIAELRSQLAPKVLTLYQAILKYMIKSICAYDRNQALVGLRNMIKLDDWTGGLEEVDKAEADFKSAASQYGIRQANTYLGLLVEMQISEHVSQMLGQLFVADMDSEIRSLQQRKDVLLPESYNWILDNQHYKEFSDWSQQDTARLLWIKGDPGKGKTMLLMGIVGELKTQLETHFDTSYLLSYFFCQGSNNSLNTATATLRGLIWMLLRQKKSLIRHLDWIQDMSSSPFGGNSAFYRLGDTLLEMLKDKNLGRAYLVVDALDECRSEEPGLPQLLDLITKAIQVNDNVKWLLSSRPSPAIETVLTEGHNRHQLSLELNRTAVAEAVGTYIDHKMGELFNTYREKHKRNGNFEKIKDKLQDIQDRVTKELHDKADGTFLWVSLAYQDIKGCSAGRLLEHVKMMPRHLNDMYDRMMERIRKFQLSELEDCKEVLLIMVTTNRPLHLEELSMLAGLDELNSPTEIVKHCGMLTIREENQTVYFVHQSALDYLRKVSSSKSLTAFFPSGYAKGHYNIVLRSLQSMSENLRRDIYGLRHIGIDIEEVAVPDPDPFNLLGYSCSYWMDHLCKFEDFDEDRDFGDAGSVATFLRKHFLHWLEALSLLKDMANGVTSLQNLEQKLEVSPCAPLPLSEIRTP